MRNLLAAAIFFIAASFASIQTRFFGNNWLPQSNAEVIADGICCIILAIGFNTLSTRK